MSEHWISLLDSLHIGTILSYVIPLGSFLIGVYIYVKKYKKKLDVDAEKRVLKRQEEEQESTDLKELIINVRNLEASIEKQNTELRKYVDKKISNLEFTNQVFKKDIDKNKEDISNYRNDIDHLVETINELVMNINILIDSDKETIRSFIISQYNISKRDMQIDLLTLQNVERLYTKYLEEMGTTSDDFMDKMMKEMRNLPTKV